MYVSNYNFKIKTHFCAIHDTYKQTERACLLIHAQLSFPLLIVLFMLALLSRPGARVIIPLRNTL